MDVIKVRLFNTPYVLKNSKKVLFPLKKAEALFYYLLVKKQASRDELAALLWGEFDERSAKKNLRNVIYKIRKTFGIDIIISPQKQIVMLNNDIKIESDLDIFLNDPYDGINVYLGEFLQGFLVKDAENFMEWIRNKIDFYRELYIIKLYKKIDLYLKKKDSINVEYYAKLLIQTDEFDERAYRILMKVFAEQGVFNKVIELYNRLSEILDKELGITPDVKTKDLYLKILDIRNFKEMNVETNKEGFFYGRHNELQTLKDGYNTFFQNKRVKSFIILGEAGIGKTKLKDEFIKYTRSAEVYLIETDCYQAEEGYLLKPWNAIFSKVYNIINKNGIDIPVLWADIIAYLFPSFTTEYSKIDINPVEKLDALKPKVIEDAILNVLRKVSQKKKIILIFEDLQWIDTMSLSLLSSIMLHITNNNIFIIGTLRTGYSNHIDKFITLMSWYNRLKIIEIERFSKEEVEDFITKALPNYKFTPEHKERLYKETEGNTFFIIEYLNIIRETGNIDVMTSRMHDILKSRIIDISEQGKKMLNIISLFFDEISLDILKVVSGKSEFKILDTIEELKSKFIIKEISDMDKISYRFTHQKLREYIYSTQSLARRRILHNKIGLILERSKKNDKRDILIYPNLIYHFSNAKNWNATLKYSIKNANVYLDFSHELFPELSDSNLRGDKYLQITKDIAIKYMEDIEALLDNVKSKENITDELAEFEIEFLHMKGRFLIREGEYDKGTELIREVINKSIFIKDFEYALKGYIQMIFYSIQTHNVFLMRKNLELALELAIRHNYKKDIGTLLRLKGLNRIMSGDYQEAEELLKESIEIFASLNKDEDKYSLSIAAAYNYIGEIRRYNKNFSDALIYYNRAIALSKDKKALSSLAVFNTNAGQAAFDNSDYYNAKRYFSEAISMYNRFDTLWGRSTAEGYGALLFVKEGKYKDALKCLKSADVYSRKLKSPYEQGLVYRVKAEIRAEMKLNKIINNVFKEYLNQDVSKYCNKGIELLVKIKKCYEIDILKALKKDFSFL